MPTTHTPTSARSTPTTTRPITRPRMPRALYGRLALVADLLPEYRVKARNTSAGGENPMHDDAGARARGFPGALVPGVTVYAYLTHTLVEAFGTAWLDRGTATVKFVKPVLDHEEVLVTGEITERNARGIAATVKATTARVGDCAVATVTLPAGLPTPVNVAQYPEKPLPTERVPVSRAHLSSVDVLGTPVTLYDLDQAGSYVDDIGDPLPIYRVDGRVHPAFYLNQANRALSRNVKLGPWVHVASARAAASDRCTRRKTASTSSSTWCCSRARSPPRTSCTPRSTSSRRRPPDVRSRGSR
ncbi:MAG: hypothetical protein DMD81_04105 [Candidatus Rokuibacteriota bacterium]|nr:MAG: hypothetical protein DMD81_04105 [Candidatus Rokubacteria bacterium]